MAITSAHELFQAIPREAVVLPSGPTVVLQALSIEAFQRIQDIQDTAKDASQAGYLFSLYALCYSIVHPETHERLFTEDDIPQLKQLGVRDIEVLMLVINRLNGFEDMTEDPDPVKKPTNGLEQPVTSPTG